MISIILSEITHRNKDGRRRFQWNEAMQVLQDSSVKKILDSDDPELVISLQGFDYIDADGLLWLLLLGDYLQSRGKLLWLELPSNKYQLKYLSDSLFVQAAQEIFTITNLYKLDIIASKNSKSYIKDSLNFLRVDINNVNDITGYYLHKTISRTLNLSLAGEMDFEVLQPFVNLLIETNKNLVQHSRSRDGEGWGYFVLAKKRFKNKNILSCTLGDCGVGFKNSLKAKGIILRTDSEAIKRALLFRYHHQEGAGLFRAVQFASRLHGVVKIRSGWASAFLNFQRSYLNNRDEVHQFINSSIKIRDEKAYFPGVQIYIEAVEGN